MCATHLHLQQPLVALLLLLLLPLTLQLLSI
jgi:hypothetical protein